ncbi:MAG: DUF3540 domain-containing protein [Deltaproteobacteria bacterium]|jgi:hypothetical protein|nr:DUF3540 domain-containing protein [Deltaproteobacteria bacterium]
MNESVLNFSPSREGGTLSRARVIKGGATPLISMEGRILSPKLSFSLMVEPMEGDLALIFEDDLGGVLLSILERADDKATGFLRLPQKSAVNLQELKVDLSKLKLKTQEGEIHSGALTLAGALCSMRFSVISKVASKIQTFARNILTRAKSLEVEGESTRLSGDNLTLTAQHDLRARAGLMDLKSKTSFRVDGRSISLG